MINIFLNNFKINLKRYKLRNSFNFNVSKLLAGVGASQVCLVLSSPILTRLFTAEHFGIFTLFTSIIGIVSGFICLRYEQAIVPAENTKEAKNILILTIISSLLVSTIIFFIIIIFQNHLKNYTIFNLLNYYIYLIPIVLIITGLNLSLTFWNVRHKNFGQNSKAYFLSEFPSIILNLTLGFLGFASSGVLILAYFIANSISTIYLIGKTLRTIKINLIKNIDFNDIIKVGKKFIHFPIFGSGAIFFGYGSFFVPVIILSLFFSPEIVGFYALCFKVFQSPVSLIGNSIGQVFLESAKSAQSLNKLDKLTSELIDYMMAMSILPFMVVCFFGEEIFSIIFGQYWTTSGTFASYLAPWAMLWFISSPFGGIFSILYKQKLQLYVNGVNFLFRVCPIFIGVFFDDPILTIKLLAIFSFTFVSLRIVLICKLTKFKIIEMIQIILKNIFIPFTVILVLFFLKFSLFDNSKIVILSILFIVINSILVLKNFIFFKRFKNFEFIKF